MKSQKKLQEELAKIPPDKLKAIYDSLTPEEKLQAKDNAMKHIMAKMKNPTLYDVATFALNKYKSNKPQ